MAHGRSEIFVEEQAEGREFVLPLWLSADGSALIWPLTRTYQGARDGENGARTGGMGASVAQADQWRAGPLREVIVKPLIVELEARGWLFNGPLALDILVDDNNVAKVLEMNTHVGDPEFRAALRATRLDVGKALRWVVARKSERAVVIAHSLQAAAEVVIASEGYPTIRPIEPLAEAMRRALLSLELPYGSTASYGIRRDGVAASGRIFAVGSTSASVQDAAKVATEMAHALVGALKREGVRCFARTDIGYG